MYLIRLLIVGDTGVGKTSLLIRFHENEFIVHQKTTIGLFLNSLLYLVHIVNIGVDYKAKEVQIESETVKLQVIPLITYFKLFMPCGRSGILPDRRDFAR
jgi:GTPase SAR1 family protein